MGHAMVQQATLPRMALTATMYRLKVELSDTDRGVYESLDLRLAQHPSEALSYLVTRALAYCLCYEEGIAWSHGLSHADEPALWVKTPDDRTTVWIEIGNPAPDRLHRASKNCPRVVIFTHHDPALLVKEVARATVHRVEHIEVFALDRMLVDDLGARLERNTRWELTRAGGQLYVTVQAKTLEGTLTPVSLTPA